MMFNLVEVVTDETKVAGGEILKTVEPGLELEINAQVVKVPFKDVIWDLDAEDPEEATVMYVEYQGEDYELELPEKGTQEWEDLMEIVYPE